MLQLQAHLQELTKVAVRAHLDEANPQKLPHAIEAVRQVSGDLFSAGEANELFGRASQPHLLHEPYMSTEGAEGMLGQTLADVVRKVDQGAEACGTLESPEFDAFRALVSSVYVGSLQKRVEYTESKERLQSHASENSSSNDTPGIARSGHQACSGDIAKALVAIAMGEGFEHFTSASAGGEEVSARTNGGSGKGSSDDRAKAKGRRGGGGGGTRGAGGDLGGLAEAGDGNKSSRAQQQLLPHEMENVVHAAAELQYLSENATILRGGQRQGGEVRGGLTVEEGNENGAGSGRRAEGRFPGLQWLAPHIIGRSIPMELRY